MFGSPVYIDREAAGKAGEDALAAACQQVTDALNAVQKDAEGLLGK